MDQNTHKHQSFLAKSWNVRNVLWPKSPSKKLAKDADLAIIESTYSNEEKPLAKEYGHMTAEQAAQTAKKQKVKQLVLTHISQRYEFKENILLKEAQKFFKNTKIAKDLMALEI